MNYSAPFYYYIVLFSSLLGAYIINHFVWLCLQLSGNWWQRLNLALDYLWSTIVSHPLSFYWHPLPLWSAALSFITIWLWYYYHLGSHKNYRLGMEYGSARWGGRRDITPFINRHPDLNIILTASEKLNFAQAKKFKYQRNHNVLVIGGSGSGKTYSHLKPNLAQLHSSYVITDPKGTILGDVGYMLNKHNYHIKVFDTVNFANSLHYNPMAYLRDEVDIFKLTNVILLNTKGEGRVGDDFWLKAEQLWLSACIGYLYYFGNNHDRHLGSLLDLLAISGASEQNENYQCPLDVLFTDLAKEHPDCFPVRQYQKFKLAAGATAKSILISLSARLAVFDLPPVRQLLGSDELALDELGQSKQALFVVLSDTDPTYHFLSAMLFYQAFDILTTQADKLPGGQLQIPVRFLLDEFANLGVLPHFDKTISTIRSRNISATVIVQSLAQLQAIYGKKSEVIVDCCDSVLFLGGKSVKTTRDLAQMIGRTTVTHQSISHNSGTASNYSCSEQIISRQLLDQSEIAALPRDECLLLISGLPPFRSKKYSPCRHPRYTDLADSGQVPKYVYQPRANSHNQLDKKVIIS